MSEAARQAQLDAAQTKLDLALREYLDVKYPGSYLEHWLVLFDMAGMDPSAPGRSLITYEEDAMLGWVHRRGMIEVAQQHVRDVQTAEFMSYYGPGKPDA